MNAKTILLDISFWILLIFAFSIPNYGFAASVDSICYAFQISPTQEPSDSPKCRVVEKTMYWEGEISNFLLHEIKNEHPEITRLELNSRGGYLDDAIEIAHYIRSKNLHTNVRDGAICASACTLVYQSGTVRTAHVSARFLYHSANYSGEDWFSKWQKYCEKNGRDQCRNYLADLIEKSQKSSQLLFDLYRDLGVNDHFFKDYQKLPESKNWFEKGNFSRLRDWLPTVPQLLNYNIVQSIE